MTDVRFKENGGEVARRQRSSAGNLDCGSAAPFSSLRDASISSFTVGWGAL